ncbi:MAG: isoaspartyl peptidase/L-asparaginase [Bacteroidales bacterium]|nr:isoaspartyl peptidase/L-asparaginase [Bacteroidales bacterium]
MKNIILSVIIIFSAITFNSCDSEKKQNKSPEYVLVIHGGAGRILKENISPEKEKQYILKLSEALASGAEILKNGGPSLDAVETAINILEDSPLFNAGKGAVFTEKGENEMDASIMDGRTLNAGAVAGVKTIKNPISAARKVMTNSKHVLLGGEGAEEFAAAVGLEIVEPAYFYTPEKWERFKKAKQKLQSKEKTEKHGTVGAVALDKHGNLAAGTSTGGMTMKMFGRIGDSPIIGAGTYANNNTCAVSATGHGEYFIRNVVAYDISALMEYKKWNLEKASDFVINEKLKSQNGSGGVITVDKDGNISMPFNTEGMFRGYINSNGEMRVLLYK